MKMYHGTTEDFWSEIKSEGVLWGRKNVYYNGKLLNRITWLAIKQEDAGIYDDQGITNEPCVLLEVDIPEFKNFNYWQYVTYEPIPISRITRIT